MPVEPIKPDEVELNITKPDGVIEAFNCLIADRWDGGRAVVLQDEAAKEIAKNMGITTEAVFNEGYLDIEPIYRAAGWRVEYDKPGFNEDYYEPRFYFTKP